MKNSVKKLTSLLLAVILIVGVFTAVPISAGAADTAVPEILGDVDGDGEVTILDATMIRRYEVQLGALSDQQQLAADVDGDGEITILDATWLQRYLNNMKAPDSIGKPMAEVYTVKAVPVLRESVDSTETAQVRVYADQPHVPYMNVKDFYDRFYLLGTDLTEGMTMTQSGSEYTLTNIADVSATFDVAKDSIYTSNFESFTQLACTLQIAASGGVDNNYPFAKTTDTNEPVDPNPLTLDLPRASTLCTSAISSIQKNSPERTRRLPLRIPILNSPRRSKRITLPIWLTSPTASFASTSICGTVSRVRNMLTTILKQ